MENFKKEEYFEKCRALLKAIECVELDSADKDTLVMCMEDYLRLLGRAIGIV